MAIFVYCEECEKCVEPGSCKHNFNLKRESMSNYINMRNNPWAKQTKVEFSQTTMEKDIAERNSR